MNLIPEQRKDVVQQGDRCFLVSNKLWYILGSDGRTWYPDHAIVPVLVDTGAAVSGDVVRLAASGVIAKAQADSLSHAVPIAGVWNGGAIVPFTAYPVATFDSQPVVGAPCYVSPTTPGALSCTRPSLALPDGLIVIEVLSSSSARVGPTGSSPVLDRKSAFLARAQGLTGIAPANMRVIWEDFDELAFNSPASPTAVVPRYGQQQGQAWPMPSLTDPRSCVYLPPPGAPNYCLWSMRHVLGTTGEVYSVPWMAVARFRLRAGATHYIYAELTKLGGNTSGIGVGGYQPLDASNFMYYGSPTYSELTAYTQVRAVELMTWLDPIQARDELFHEVCLWSAGDGAIKMSWDNGATVSKVIPADGRTNEWLWRIGGGGVDVDYTGIVY